MLQIRRFKKLKIKKRGERAYTVYNYECELKLHHKISFQQGIT